MYVKSGKLKLGDIVLRKPHIKVWPYSDSNANVLKCRVVYIHPKGRFHCVEFEDGVRECYPGISREVPRYDIR